MDMLKIPARTTNLEINIWRRKFKLAKPLQGVFDQKKNHRIHSKSNKKLEHVLILEVIFHIILVIFDTVYFGSLNISLSTQTSSQSPTSHIPS